MQKISIISVSTKTLTKLKRDLFLLEPIIYNVQSFKARKKNLELIYYQKSLCDLYFFLFYGSFKLYFLLLTKADMNWITVL